MKKILLGLAALSMTAGVAAADDYVVFQMIDDDQYATNIINIGLIDDLDQSAVNVGNQATVIDTDSFNDSYNSRQILNDSQDSDNVANIFFADDVIQLAANEVNDLEIRDADGIYALGIQDVTSRQSTYDQQRADNTINIVAMDDLDQTAANRANTADIKLSNSNLNGVDVVSSQYLGDDQYSTNIANIGAADQVGQVAQNVANIVLIKH